MMKYAHSVPCRKSAVLLMESSLTSHAKKKSVGRQRILGLAKRLKIFEFHCKVLSKYKIMIMQLVLKKKLPPVERNIPNDK